METLKSAPWKTSRNVYLLAADGRLQECIPFISYDQNILHFHVIPKNPINVCTANMYETVNCCSLEGIARKHIYISPI